MRDISKYTDEYLKEGFESIQVKYRRKKILSIMGGVLPGKIIEIGCGMHPIFEFWNDFNEYIFFEPSEMMFQNAMKIRNKDNRIRGYNEPFCVKDELLKFKPDFIICSSLLHELEDPGEMLKSISTVSHVHTLIHINVPNANSFHRILAKSMQIINSTKEKSERNVNLQQSKVYDMDELVSAVEGYSFRVVEKGSYFVKPFTHAQMWEILRSEIIDEKVLDGLYAMGEDTGGFGSEIYVNLKIMR